MKNCDENQNLVSRLNVFSFYARTYILNICNIRPCFMAGFFELLQKEDFFLCKPNFLSIMRVENLVIL